MYALNVPPVSTPAPGIDGLSPSVPQYPPGLPASLYVLSWYPPGFLSIPLSSSVPHPPTPSLSAPSRLLLLSTRLLSFAWHQQSDTVRLPHAPYLLLLVLVS